MVEYAITLTQTDESDDDTNYGEYFIDPVAAESSHRSLSVLVSSRQCYMCQQSFDEEVVIASDPQDFIDQISAHCAQEQDFLLPDTPMKEAVFRVILGGGNEPKDAQAISMALAEKWAMTPFPRDTSPRVIQRLLDNSAYYCLSTVPEPGGPRRGVVSRGGVDPCLL